jgi:hypothetical protein
MLRLPISGAHVRWRPVTGHDEIAVAESGVGIPAALALATACAVEVQGYPWEALPLGDLDFLVAARRREARGDTFVAAGSCGDCGEAVDVRLGITAYVAHHAPRRPRGAVPAADGWWQLNPALAVRVPTVGDVLAAAAEDDPRGALLRRCTRGEDGAPVRGGRLLTAAERGMAALAPTLRGEVDGSCPECAATVLLEVDLRELCMSDLRFLADGVYDEVHLLASTYGWSQSDILDMPVSRRGRYADLILGRSAYVVSDEVISVG